MNYHGKSPLEMFCPNCNSYGAHPVIRTEPKWYHCGNDAVAMFKQIAGRDISWRQRSKRCIKCGESFNSIEMAGIFLSTLVAHAQHLQVVNDLLNSSLSAKRRQITQLESERKTTHVAIRKASKLLNRQLPGRGKRKPVDVGGK